PPASAGVYLMLGVVVDLECLLLEGSEAEIVAQAPIEEASPRLPDDPAADARLPTVVVAVGVLRRLHHANDAAVHVTAPRPLRENPKARRGQPAHVPLLGHQVLEAGLGGDKFVVRRGNLGPESDLRR